MWVKTEKFKAKTTQTILIGHVPSPKHWKSKTSVLPTHLCICTPHLARCDGSILFHPNSHARGALGLSPVGAVIPGHFCLSCREVENIQISWGKEWLQCAVLPVLTLPFIQCLRSKVCLILVTWQLYLAHKCSKVNNSSLHMTSWDSLNFQT